MCDCEKNKKKKYSDDTNFNALFNPNCELIQCCVDKELCEKVEKCLEKNRCSTVFEWSPPCYSEIVPLTVQKRINTRGKLVATFLNTIRQIILDALSNNDYTELSNVINANPFIEEFTITDKNGNVIFIS